METHIITNDFDKEKYPRKNKSEYVDSIDLDYSCEPLTSYEVYEKYLKSVWPKEGTYDYFKLTGSGHEGELSSASLTFYKLVPETDEQWATRVYFKMRNEEKQKAEYEMYVKRDEARMREYIKKNADKIKNWLNEK